MLCCPLYKRKFNNVEKFFRFRYTSKLRARDLVVVTTKSNSDLKLRNYDFEIIIKGQRILDLTNFERVKNC